MEVPVINRISEFDVGINSINEPSFLSRAHTVVGNLHHAYNLWKWGALLIIALCASFTTLITRIKSLVLRLKNVDVSLPSPTLLYDYDCDSDSSCSSESSDDDDQDEGEDDEDDREDDSVSRWRRVKGDLRIRGSDDNDKGIIGNIPWIRRCRGSFGDLLSWPDLGGLASSGVVKLWDNLDINGEGSHRNAVASFFSKCSPAVLLAAGNKGNDAVEVSAWDSRAGFEMPALLAEWRQPGRLLGKIIGVEAADVEKIYVGNDVGEEMTVGDMRMVNRMVTESEVDAMVRRRRRY